VCTVRPPAIQAAIEVGDVVDQHRLEIRIDQRGRHARPFADARQHLARQRDMELRTFRLDQRAGFLLMRRVHEREQVADRDRFDPGRVELACGAAHRLAIEPHEHAAFVVAALGNLPGQALRRDRERLGVEIVEQVAVARLVLDFLHGAEALGDEEPDLGAAHLQERVGGDGGAMGEKRDARGRDAALGETRHAVEHTERRILRRARHLLDHHLSGRGIEQDQVRVGAAHIDTQPILRRAHVHDGFRGPLVVGAFGR
jgi:hypothetical protein